MSSLSSIPPGDVEYGTREPESTPKSRKGKHSAWVQDEVENISLKSTTVPSEAIVDEDETSFNVSPAHKLIPPAMSKRRQHRRKQKAMDSPRSHAEGASSTVTSPRVVSSVPIPAPRQLLSPAQTSRGELDKKLQHLRVDSPIQITPGSRRPSVGDSSLESRSLTSQSDNRSYRDRIRDRIQSVREQAGSAVTEATSRSRLKHRLLTQPGVSRFDDLLRKEEAQVGAALKQHERSRADWRQAAQAATQMHSEEEGYDFFTQVWEADTAEEEQQQQQVQPDAPTSAPDVEDVEESAEESTKLLVADYLGLKDEWELVEPAAPVYQSWRERVAREQNLYFYPGMRPVSLEDKLQPDCQPRYPEEEGLYVGTRIPLAPRNRNRLEQRILASGDRRWFGDDGEVLTLPDPRRAVPYRPPLFEELSPLLQFEYKPALASEEDSRMMNDTYLLEVEVSSVSFSHHPLFSREHVLGQRLAELYRRYNRRAVLGREERLGGRLEALRRARDGLRQALEHTKEPTPQQMDRLNRYMSEVRAARLLAQSEGRSDRQLLAGVLSSWRDLKRLRQQQGYAATPWKLHIHTPLAHDMTAVEERRAWDMLISAEWAELEEELTQEYNRQWEEHSKSLARWKKKRKAVREARKRRQQEAAQRIEQDSVDDPDGDVDEEEPRPPAPVDWAAVRTDMMQRLGECFRPPGEPRVALELTTSGNVESDPSCPREQQRRSALKRCSLHARVLYNGREVCRTCPQPLGPRFEVHVGEAFSIRIAQWPQSLKVELHEEGGALARYLVAEVFVPIPNSSTTLQMAQSVRHEFSNNQVMTFNHAGVGSGTYSCPFPGVSTDGTSGGDLTCLYTSGILTCKVGWGMDEKETILAPPEKYWAGTRRDSVSTDMGSLLDVDRLREWAETARLDPNDPSNAGFFSYLKTAGVGLMTEPTYFRLDPLQAEFDFCTSEELENNVRLRLLKLRDRGEPEFRGLRQIPLREKEIPKDIFKAYEHRLAAPELPLAAPSADPLESHRAWGRHYLNGVRQRVLKQCRQAQQNRQLQDVVTEDQVPDIGTLGLTFVQWLQPKRPLRPARKERKKVAVQSLGGQEVRLVVTIVRAVDVPVRREPDPTPAQLPSGQRFAVVPVRPFVEATFQGASARTTTAAGANPTWNQELQLPLQPPSRDFSAGTLQSIQDALHLHLFDETVVDLLEDDRVRDTNIHQRLERHWLGSLRVPFTTLYHNARIEGTFKLYSPPVLLGYEREPQHHQFSGLVALGETQQSFVPQQDATFLTLFITVQPALNPPEPFKDRVESGEPAFLQEHLEMWQSQVLAQFPHRRPKTLVMDISGKSVCVTRFFRPLEPPELSEGEPTTTDMAARFVSMIPTVAGSTLFPGLFDVWLSCEQVLLLLSGDSEDLAVLLCCFLLHLGHRVWVLLGAGVPHGPSAYVLECRQDGGFWLWDPASGQRYDVQDSFCPVQKVFCLINDENIWANVQGDELPRRTRYDVSRRSDWWPAFGRGVSVPTGSIQPVALHYRPTAASAVQLLQDRMEKHLRDSLMKWRPTTRTLWNRYCIAILRKLLPALERASWSLEVASGVDHMQELQHILDSHKMCGFPINLPYTDMDAITESVRATGVHFCESPDVEFALAVHIHPFCNNVLSVWVYVASLERRR